MATKSEWRHKEISSVAVGDKTIIWKTQKSIAPDGKKFLGLRKFFTKKDGSEQVTNAGLSLQVTADDAHKEELKAIIKLLQGLL